jgi:hypothetical protein
MPADVPQNGGYLLAAYIVAPVILGGYLGMLWRRLRRVAGRGSRIADRSDESRVA